MIAKIGKKATEETINGAIFQIGLGKSENSKSLVGCKPSASFD
jgi:hypothetical protein